MWKNVILLAACAMILCACGSNSHTVRLPDATQGFSVNCNGDDGDWAECYNEAAKICNGPYTIVNSNNMAVDEVPMRNIIVKCNQ